MEQYEAAFMATTRIIRFIKGLGYEAIDAQALVPVIPYAIESGLGELGRMNRMINPIFGGNIRIASIITDFPLALDKPIDFGLPPGPLVPTGRPSPCSRHAVPHNRIAAAASMSESGVIQASPFLFWAASP